jgi:hypothetical protein
VLFRVTTNDLFGTNGRIQFSLDGLTFYRSKSGAAARDVGRIHEVPWAEIESATLVESSTGRHRLRLVLTDPGERAPGRKDPHELKLKHRSVGEARHFVAKINDELAGRRRWRVAAEPPVTGT